MVECDGFVKNLDACSLTWIQTNIYIYIYIYIYILLSLASGQKNGAPYENRTYHHLLM